MISHTKSLWNKFWEFAICPVFKNMVLIVAYAIFWNFFRECRLLEFTCPFGIIWHIREPQFLWVRTPNNLNILKEALNRFHRVIFCLFCPRSPLPSYFFVVELSHEKEPLAISTSVNQLFAVPSHPSERSDVFCIGQRTYISLHRAIRKIWE